MPDVIRYASAREELARIAPGLLPKEHGDRNIDEAGCRMVIQQLGVHRFNRERLGNSR